VNYTDKRTITLSKPLGREKACKLDSKARLVLPLEIRDLLSVSYGDCVSISVLEKNGGGLLLKITPAEGTPNGEFVKVSKNSWEKR